MIAQNFSLEWANMLIGFLGLVATVVGLSFTYKKITKQLQKKSIVFCRDCAETDEWIKKRIAKIRKPKNAYFIDYSGDNAKSLVKDALKKRWTVHIYLKEADHTTCKFQSSKIDIAKQTYEEEFQEEIRREQLIMRYYDQIPSVRLRYFEGAFIAFSWYYYLCKNMIDNYDPTGKTDNTSEKNNAIGHDCPSFIVEKKMDSWRGAKAYWDKYLGKFIACMK